jgi:glycine cleavage system H protein
METKNGLLYSRDHEWLDISGSQATVGITDYAQDSLGEIVFVELPAVGLDLATGDVLGVVESVKAASEVYAPVSGRVLRANEALHDQPELLNRQPYAGWIAVLELSNMTELDGLMDETGYLAFCAREGA